MIVHLDHPNAQQVRRAAMALADLVDEVVFVGGLMIPFSISDRGSDDPFGSHDLEDRLM